MILTCPSCATRYFADDASIGANGRSVRCAGCGCSWFVEPQLELRGDGLAGEPPLTRERVERLRRAAGNSSLPASPAASFRAKQTQRQSRDRMRAAMLAWGATGVALAGTTTSAVAFRDEVTKVFPKAASAYAAVGLDVNVFGLQFRDLEVSHAFDGPNPVLVVRGAVANLGHEAKPAPILRFGLRDQEQQEIQHVLAHMTQAKIAGGVAAPFEVRIEDASPDAVDLEATFDTMGSSPQAEPVVAGGGELADPPPAEGLLKLDTLAPAHVERARADADGLASRLNDG